MNGNDLKVKGKNIENLINRIIIFSFKFLNYLKKFNIPD